MKKRRLKGFVIPVFSGIIVSVFVIGLITFEKSLTTNEIVDNNLTYVSSAISDNTLPVISEEDVIIRPYDVENINIYKKFYDGKANKENSIIYMNGTYMQSSGIVYNSDDEFNVISILDGEVIDVKKDDLFNYVVEIKHSNNLISSYEGLKSINVKKGDKVSQKELIGKSGEINLDVNLKNAILFEIIKDGEYVNPEELFDKTMKEI